MSTITTFSDALRLFVEDYMRGVYSILPAKVIAVDYSVPSVDVSPIVYNVNAAGDSIPIADVLDVPLFVFSADSGNLQISMPVKVGDRVALLCSDSDTTSVMTTAKEQEEKAVRFIETNKLYPLCALPSFFTPAQPHTIDSENIVINNHDIKITVKSDKVVVDGDMEINGNVKLNGSQQTTGTSLTEGQIIGQEGLSVSGGSGVQCSGNMTVTGGNVVADGIGLKTHRHNETGTVTNTPIA